MKESNTSLMGMYADDVLSRTEDCTFLVVIWQW